MGTIDSSPDRVKGFSTMVPLVVLLALVPLALCGGGHSEMSMDMDDMHEMMMHMMKQKMMGGMETEIDDLEDLYEYMMKQRMMSQMGMNNMGNMQMGGMGMNNMQMGGMGMNNMMNGMGMNNMGGGMQGMQSQEDYEAYLKYCEERKVAAATREQHEKLMEMYKKKEEEKKEKERHKRMENEAHEKHEMMMSQFKAMEKRVEETEKFEKLGYELMEMKAKYTFMVTAEFLKFCKCSDFTSDLERFFMQNDISVFSEEYDLDDLDDLEGIDTNDPVAVAQALANRPLVEQVAAFFGGLADAMCDGARDYVDQIEAYEKQYNFLERLM